MNQEIISIGKVLPNYQIYILDPYLQPLPIGITGEIYIGGVGVARGYLNLPELTAEKFIDNPFGEGKLYKTGDLARYLPDGNIDFVGRIDEQVKIRGFRIELGEIEANINKYPDIKEVVVITQNHNGNQYLVVYIISNKKIHISKLRKYLADNLPDYMIPAAFVFLEQFPLTINGKIDKKSLPKINFDDQREEEYVAPSNDIEIQLASIYKEVLDVEKVGINDNFFFLGGHSLLATQLVAKIYNQLKIDIPLKVIFEKSTIKEIADYINNKSVNNYHERCIVEINSQGEKTPLYFINSTKVAYDLKKYLSPEQPLYSLNIFGLTTRIKKPFDELTISDFAKYIIDDLLNYQSVENINLLGFCQDGALTLEIAKQLKYKGKNINLLGLIDVIFKYQKITLIDRIKMLKEFKLTYLKPRIKMYGNKIKNKLGITQIITDKSENVNSKLPEKVQLDKLLYKNYWKAIKNYETPFYDGEIVSFRTLEWKNKDYQKLEKITNNNVKVINIKSTHHSLFEEPYIQLFARHLQDILKI